MQYNRMIKTLLYYFLLINHCHVHTGYGNVVLFLCVCVLPSCDPQHLSEYELLSWKKKSNYFSTQLAAEQSYSYPTTNYFKA